MDYHSMKRKELQALCKKHNIPANSTNSVMADTLSQLLNEKQKPATRRPTCMKNLVGTVDDSDPAVMGRQAKKVRFSPNNELVEYELRSAKKEEALVTKTKHKGKAVAKEVEKPVVDNTNIVKLVDDSVQISVKLTRSRVQLSGKDGVMPVIEKKQGKRAVDDVEKVSGLVEQSKVSRVRVTRSKVQRLNEDDVGSDLNPCVEKKNSGRVAKDSKNVESSKETVDIPVRVTRSREQTLKDNIGNTAANPVPEKKRTRREMKVSEDNQELPKRKLRNREVEIVDEDGGENLGYKGRKNTRKVSEDNQELPKRKLRSREVEIVNEDGGETLGHQGRKKTGKESVAEVPENQYHADKGSRRSRRNKTKAEESISMALDQNVTKVEVVNVPKITRSKSKLAVNSSQAVQQLVEPLEHSGSKNMNRRKSIIKPENTEVVLHLEGLVNCPSGKDTKRKSGKKEVVKETEIVESPDAGTRKTLGRKQSKEQSGQLSMIDEGFEDTENVARSGKDASGRAMNAVASATGSHRSRKRRGDPVIEDHASLVAESPKRCTRSSSKSEGKTQQQSSLKTPTSRMDNQPVVESVLVEGQPSGATIRGKSSKKRAKLTVSPHGTKQKSDSEKDDAEESNTKETPVLKLVSSEIDERVTTTESTPAIDESVRRLTRSAIKSEREAVGSVREKGDKKKQPSQSAIKGQPIGVAVIETPRRFTRSGVKHGGITTSKLSEKADKKKLPSRSALKEQPLENEQTSSPEVAEVRPNPDVTSSSKEAKVQSTMRDQKTVQDDTIGVQSETPEEAKVRTRTLVNPDDLSTSEPVRLQAKDVEENTLGVLSETPEEAKGRILVNPDDLSTSEPVRLQAKDAEENTLSTSEAAVMENLSSVSEHNASGVELNPISDGSNATQSLEDFANVEDETPAGTNLSDTERTPLATAEAAEIKPDAVSDGSHVQNQNHEVYVKSSILNEADVPTTVNSVEALAQKSSRIEADEQKMEFTKSGSGSENLQIDKEMDLINAGSGLVNLEINEAMETKARSGSENLEINEEMETKSGSGSENMQIDGIVMEQIDEVVKDPVVSVGTVVTEENVDISFAVITKGNNDDVEACFSAVSHAAVEQSDLKITGDLNEMEASLEGSASEGLEQCIADDRDYAQIEKGSEQDALTGKDPLQSSNVGGHEVSDNGECDDEDKRISNEPVFEDNRVHDSIDVLQSPEMGNRDDAQDTESVTVEKSTGDKKLQDSLVVHEVSDNGECNDEDKRTSNVPIFEDNRVHDSIDVLQSPELGNKDDAQDTESDTIEQSAGDKKLQESLVDHEVSDNGECDDEDKRTNKEPVFEENRVHDGLEVLQSPKMRDRDDAQDIESDTVEQSTGDKKLQDSLVDHEVSDNSECDDEDKGTSKEPVFEENRVHDGLEVFQSPEICNRDDAQDIESDTVEQSISDNKLQDSLVDHGEPSPSEIIINNHDTNRSDVADDAVDFETESAKDLELEAVPSTGNDEDDIVDATKEIESDSMPSIADFNKHESDPKLSTGNDASNTPVFDKDDDFDTTREFEPVSEPSTANCLLEIPLSCNDVDYLGPDMKSSTGNYVFDTTIVGKDDAEDDSEPMTSTANTTLEIPVSGVNIVNDFASDSKPLTGNDASDIHSLHNDDVNVIKELESDSEAATDNINEIPVLGTDVEDECADANKELENKSNPVSDNYEFETPSMEDLDVVVGKVDGQDGESEHELLTSSDRPSMDEQDAQDENKSVVPEVFNGSFDQEPEAQDAVDGCASVGQSDSSTSKKFPQILAASGDDDAVIGVDAQEAIMNINNDSVSNTLGGIDGQKIIETSEVDESVWLKECENVSPDMMEQKIEEAEMTTENDPVLDDINEQMVATIDHDLDRDKFMDDGSSHGIDELDQLVGSTSVHNNPTSEESSQERTVDDTVADRFMGDIGAHTSPIVKESLPITYNKEESPVDDTLADPPTSFKDDDKNTQDETKNTITSVDWGSYSLGLDEIHNPVSGNDNDDVLGKAVKDGRVSVEEGTSPDGKSSQDVDIMKANANVDVAEGFFNWSEDSSLRAFFVTPTTSRINLKDNQEDMVGFTFPDDRSEDIGTLTNGTEAHDFHHQWGNEPIRGFNEETQDTVAQREGLSDDPENEMFGVENFEDFSQQYFGDKEVDTCSGDMLGKNEHFDLLSEEAGASHLDASGLKDNLLPSDESEKKQHTEPKGSETGGDFSFDKGTGEK